MRMINDAFHHPLAQADSLEQLSRNLPGADDIAARLDRLERIVMDNAPPYLHGPGSPTPIPGRPLKAKPELLSSAEDSIRPLLDLVGHYSSF